MLLLAISYQPSIIHQRIQYQYYIAISYQKLGAATQLYHILYYRHICRYRRVYVCRMHVSYKIASYLMHTTYQLLSNTNAWTWTAQQRASSRSQPLDSTCMTVYYVYYRCYRAKARARSRKRVSGQSFSGETSKAIRAGMI